MTALKYKPYASDAAPFSIGLSALDLNRWIEPDADLGAFLDEKQRLLRENFDAVFQTVEGSEPAQRECLDMLAAYLLDHHADIYGREGSVIRFAGRSVDLDADRPPLLIAGSLVEDDLVILQKRDTGWHVTAGYVAFPSSWSLREKIGLPMEGVHHHVPGFAGGTRNAMMVNRIFDNLQADLPAMRLNWSVYPEGELFWPPERGARQEGRPFNPATNFIRVERQTLCRLPKTGGIVFTIRIYSDPIGLLTTLPDGAGIASKLADRLESFSPEQLAYKGMVSKKAALVAFLRGIA